MADMILFWSIGQTASRLVSLLKKVKTPEEEILTSKQSTSQVHKLFYSYFNFFPPFFSWFIIYDYHRKCFEFEDSNSKYLITNRYYCEKEDISQSNTSLWFVLSQFLSYLYLCVIHVCSYIFLKFYTTQHFVS